VAALVAALMVSRVRFDTNILRLLPRDSPAVRDLQTFLQEFGSLDHLYILFESSDPINDHADLIGAYVDELRRAPEVDTVESQLFEEGKDWTYLSDRELLLLGPRGAAEALARLRPPKLQKEIAHARDLLALPSPQIKAYVQQDPLGLLGLLRERLGREKGFVSFDPAQEGYVSLDRRSRLVIAKPRGSPFDTDFCKVLFARLDAVERAARAAAAHTSDAANGAAVTIQAAGGYRVSIETERVMRREGTVNAVGSMAILLLLVYVLFRTPLMMLYGSIPLTLAALLALGINGAMRRALSPATSGSAGMLFGLGIDGIVLLYMRFLEERHAGRSAADATGRMAGTASSVVLAQMTTAATFFALLFIDFPTLEDLGGLVGVGIILCCTFTLLLLPPLLAFGSTHAGRAREAAWLGRLVVLGARPILWASLVATVVLGAAATRLRVDTSIDRLQARTAGAQLEQQMAERFSLPRDVLLVLNENDELQPLIEADDRLGRALGSQHPPIASSGISLLLPPGGVQDGVAEEIRTSGITPSEVERNVRAAGEQAGFRRDAFAPFLARVRRVIDPNERITYDGLIEHGLGSLVSRFVSRRPESTGPSKYVSVTYVYPQLPVDVEALSAIAGSVDTHLRLTGTTIVNRDMARRFWPQFARGITLGTIVVVLLMWLVFRSIRDSLLALLPTAVGFVWSAGLLALTRVQLDLFSMFAAVVCIGIAVDYGIYILYRYALEGPRDMREVLTRTGAAVAIACTTALIGFGTLINSSYGPLRAFGTASVVTLACCLAASLLLLPALILEMERWSRPAR
jgi:predicted RND superfamily exporter protein